MNYLISLFLHSSGVTEESQNNEHSNTDYSKLIPLFCACETALLLDVSQGRNYECEMLLMAICCTINFWHLYLPSPHITVVNMK